MMTPEQFAEKQAKERAAFELEQSRANIFIEAGLPVPDYISSGHLHGAVYVTYRNDALNPHGIRGAIDIFKQFPVIVPCNVLRSSCTMIHPEKHLPEKEQKQGYKRGGCQNGDYAAYVKVDHIRNSQTKASIEFFAIVGGKLFDVSVEFGRDYIGNCGRLAPNPVETRGRGGRLESRTFNASPLMNGMFDTFISYASGDIGPIKESASHCYFLSAENGEENKPPSDCSHALGMLENLADALGE